MQLKDTCSQLTSLSTGILFFFSKKIKKLLGLMTLENIRAP